MSRKLLLLSGIAFAILAGTLVYGLFCCRDRQGAEAEAAGGEAPVAIRPPFAVTGEGFDYRASAGFRFRRGDYRLLLPAGDSVDLGVEQLKAHFAARPGQLLEITGYGAPEEGNPSVFPTLGYARAFQVKNYFLERGFPAAALRVCGKVSASCSAAGDSLAGAVAFRILAAEAAAPGADSAGAEALKAELNARPLTLRFGSGAAEILLTPEEREKMAALAAFLDREAEALLRVTGHTDNTGGREENLRLGLERAEFIKAYLVANGLAPARIVAASRGPDEPVAGNGTPEGRSQNRRTVIVIQ